MSIFTVLAISAVLALLAVLIKQLRFEIGVLFSAFLSISLLFYAIGQAAPLMAGMRALSEDTGYGGYLPYLFKAMAIGLVSEVSSDVCRDCGEGSAAQRIELLGKVAILGVCMPLILEIADTARFFFS